MKHWYPLLTKEEKEIVCELFGKVKTTLQDRTLKEHFAKVVIKHRGKLIESLIIKEVEESVKKGAELASKRKRVLEAPTYLSIYNGIATTSLLSGESIVKADDAIVWDDENDSDMRRKCVKFQDIFHLSALYCAIKRNEKISRDNRIRVSIDDVYNVAHPNLYASEADMRQFMDEVYESIQRFEQLGGIYYKKKDDDTTLVDIGYSQFFIEYADDNGLFPECGDGGYAETVFLKSQYQKICEDQKRLVGIGEPYLGGDTRDEDAILAYLVYRHQYAERNSKIKSVIFLQTLKEDLCIERRLQDGEVEAWIDKLKPLFKDCNVRNGKITWTKKGAK